MAGICLAGSYRSESAVHPGTYVMFRTDEYLVTGGYTGALAADGLQTDPKGEHFIRQGEEADQFYLILKGSCIVGLEKDNMSYTLAQLGPGNLVGEMAVFTGEKRSAGVEAETDMDVLSMSRDRFEKLAPEYPEFKRYLSEIVTHRLSTSKIMADKKIGKYTISEKIGDGVPASFIKEPTVFLICR